MNVFIGILLLLLLIQQIKSNEINGTIIEVAVNDVVELKCFDDDDVINNTNENETTHTKSSQSTNLNDWRLVIIKKDNVVTQIHEDKLVLKVGNQTDQGVYECGYYNLDRYAGLTYNCTAIWIVKVIEKYDENGLNYDKLFVDESHQLVDESIARKINLVLYWVIGFGGLILVILLVYAFVRFQLRNRVLNKKFEAISTKPDLIDEKPMNNKQEFPILDATFVEFG